MSVPGSNLLAQALSVIQRQSFSYVPYSSRTLQANGQWLAAYGTPLAFTGSFQPVARDLYEKYGLDLQRNYANVYLQRDVIDVARDVSGDQIVFQGLTYQCLSRTPWYGVDGWDAILCIQVVPPG